MFDVHVPADVARRERVVCAVLARCDPDGPRERVERDLDAVHELADVTLQIPDVNPRLLEVLGQQAEPHLAGEEDVVPPALVLAIEEFDLEDVARLRALDRDRGP